MPDRRVAITGLGVVTSAGVGMEALWTALMEKRSCIKDINLFDAGKFPCRVAGQLDDFSARNYVPKDYRKAVKVMARDIELAVAAADQAFRDAGLTTRGIDPASVTIDPKRTGCNIGAGLICTDLDELGLAVNSAVRDGKFDLRAWGEVGMNNLTPLWLLKYLPNMLSCHVTIIHGCEGPSNTITCGDASGHLAVGEATRLVGRGGADVAIAGGAESKINPMGLLRQAMLGRLATEANNTPATACRPFDSAHAGSVIGEGGGLLILEEMDRAKQRGARIYAEVVGFGAACDPQGIDVQTPTAGSLALAVKAAMRSAGIGPEQIGAIVAHGTGSPGEDGAESAQWEQVLGDRLPQVPAVAITGAVGSLFAGAGGASLGVAARMLTDQVVPPTVNFTTPAANCRLSLAAEARAAKFDYVVSATFGIGGQSAAVILKRC